ncbi:MAG TPA: 50S ribosomal protein L25 [Acidimicrobiales bacterium]|nr:50S ribosomal protein L25 [Acidimicrobiales bacterium]
MADVRLAAETRTDRGTARAGRLRKTGRIPGILYGHGTDPISVSVDARELRTALSGDAGLNALLNLEVDGGQHTALARELQRHPVKGTVQHIDFQIVDRNEAITVDVPVEVIGEAHEVQVQGGQVVLDVVSLNLNATPATIPTVIEIDVTDLEIGQVIRLGDIALPTGVTSDLDPETVLVSGVAQREEEEEAAEGEGGEAAEGEGGGEATADGGDAAGESSDGE